MRIKQKSCGICIYKKHKETLQILLVKSGHNQPWGFPKGKMEENETEQECAVREVREELGLKFRIQDLEESPRFYQYNKRKDLVIFTLDSDSNHSVNIKNIKPRMGEIYSFKWISVSKLKTLKDLEFCENQLEILRDSLEYLEHLENLEGNQK